MSEQATEVTKDSQGSEVVELPPQGDSAFAALMDTLAPDEDSETPTAGGEGAGAAAPEGGQPAPAAEGAGTAGADAAAPAAGDGGEPVVAGEPAAADTPVPAVEPAGDAPPAGTGAPEWDADSAGLTAKFGEISNAVEERVSQAFQSQALDEVRTDHAEYFAAIEKHPRLLVGVEVQSLTGEGKEVLRDADDAREWQEAVKTLLVQEVQDRTSRSIEASSGYLDTIHQSIELFQNNADLVPKTKQFNKELADKFAQTVQPYEVRVDGKLHGYTIPVQPIVNQIRAQLAADRAAPAATATPTASAKGPAGEKQAVPADPPQAGIASKAGDSGDSSNDFSTLFGTIGLPNLRI